MFDTYIDIFSRRADSYHEAMTRWPDARRAEFAAVLEPLTLPAGAVLCDLPSAGGYLRQWLPSDGIDYVAIEPSGHFFENCPEDDRARRLCCPIEAVALEDRSVDHVVSVAGLHHVPDLGPVFAEMARIVRPGGKVVIVEVDSGSRTARFLNGFVDAHNPAGHDGRFLDAGTAGLLEHAGLRIQDDAAVLPPWSFGSPVEMGAFCTLLFGMQGVSPIEVADALDVQFERCDGPGAINIAWPLRRLICTPR
jgi:SAM-dependent methyltransferase